MEIIVVAAEKIDWIIENQNMIIQKINSNNEKDDEYMMSVKKAAKTFDISEDYIRQKINKGMLVHYRAESMIRVKKEDIEKLFVCVSNEKR